MKRVLFFTPYGLWDVPTVHEVVIAQGLKDRGANVSFLCCDAIFSDCDVARKVEQPRTSETCHKCMERSVAIFQKMSMPCEWLSAFLTKDEKENAFLWSESLQPDEIESAVYQEMPLGEWCKLSLQRHLGISRVDCHNREVEVAYRSYLKSAVCALDALDNALEKYRPDVVIALNGHHFSHRILFELAWHRGIRSIAHERGWEDNTLAFWENEIALGFLGTLSVYNKWKEAPLTEQQLLQTKAVLESRELGKLGVRDKVSHQKLVEESIGRLNKLGLSLEKPLVTLFVSLEEALDLNEDGEPVKAPIDVVKDCLDYFSEREDLELLVRLDPSLQTPHERNQAFMAEFQHDCSRDLPPNAAVLLPEESMDPYVLIRLSERCIMYSSPLAIDAAAQGKPVMVNEPNCFYSHNFTYDFHASSSFKSSLAQFLAWEMNRSTLETMSVGAYRSAYHYFKRLSLVFPPVSIDGAYPTGANIDAHEDCSSESDAALEQVCRAVLTSVPIYPVPYVDELPSVEAEKFYFESLLEDEKSQATDTQTVVVLSDKNQTLSDSIDAILDRNPQASKIVICGSPEESSIVDSKAALKVRGENVRYISCESQSLFTRFLFALEQIEDESFALGGETGYFDTEILKSQLLEKKDRSGIENISALNSWLILYCEEHGENKSVCSSSKPFPS